MITEKEIYDKIVGLTELMNLNLAKIRQTKFTGAMTIEVLREALKDEGLNVSERDSFIKGLSNEIDLLIIKNGANPIFNSFYNPNDVLAIFEIKFSGLFSKEDVPNIKILFKNVKDLNPNIKCVYLAVSENRTYRYRATNLNLNGGVFELFSPEKGRQLALKKGNFYESSTGDWERLIEYLKR